MIEVEYSGSLYKLTLIEQGPDGPERFSLRLDADQVVRVVGELSGSYSVHEERSITDRLQELAIEDYFAAREQS